MSNTVLQVAMEFLKLCNEKTRPVMTSASAYPQSGRTLDDQEIEARQEALRCLTKSFRSMTRQKENYPALQESREIPDDMAVEQTNAVGKRK